MSAADQWHDLLAQDRPAPATDWAPGPRHRAPYAPAERAAMTRRIVRAWRAASPDDLAAGLSWYARAARAAHALDPENPARAAGVIAALSPRNRWAQNLADAAAVLAAADDPDGGCYPPSGIGMRVLVEQAWAIAYWKRAPLDVLGGPKVRAFYRNIMGDPDAVTVDVWAARVALGERAPATIPAPRYHYIAEAYRRAARALGVAPRDLQAAVWVHERGSAD